MQNMHDTFRIWCRFSLNFNGICTPDDKTVLHKRQYSVNVLPERNQNIKNNNTSFMGTKMLLRITSTPCLHALACGVLLLVGVPSNVAVIWIHTRKNSRVARDEFALIFAGINLFALVTSLPMIPLMYTRVDLTLSAVGVCGISELFSYCFQLSMSCYLIVLLMATIEKFKEVMFTCKLCMTKPATHFYSGVAIRGMLAVALGFILTYESMRELKVNGYSHLFRTIHTEGVTILGIISCLMFAKFYCTWEENLNPVNNTSSR